jgi:hypothetical protein
MNGRTYPVALHDEEVMVQSLLKSSLMVEECQFGGDSHKCPHAHAEHPYAHAKRLHACVKSPHRTVSSQGRHQRQTQDCPCTKQLDQKSSPLSLLTTSLTSLVSQLNGFSQYYYCQSLVNYPRHTSPFPHRSQPHGQARVARMATSDVTKITENFPHKTIPPIVGQPAYKAIKELHLKLNENAVKVHSNLGDGLLGYLGVTVTPYVVP